MSEMFGIEFWEGSIRCAWSAGSLSDFKRCPHYYRRTRLENWTKPFNVDMVFGTAVHAGIAAYYSAAGGAGGTDRLHSAIREALTAGGELASAGEGKTKPNMVRALIAWHDAYGVDSDGWLPLLPEADPSNEVPFIVELDIKTPGGQPYQLVGVLDRVVRLRGKPAIIDTKSTGAALSSYFFNRFQPDTQISVYAGIGAMLFPDYRGKVLIDGIFITKYGVEVYRHELNVVDGAAELRDAEFWIKQAEGCSLAGYWPRNRSVCGLYGGCMFREVCAAPERAQEAILREKFVQKVVDAPEVGMET